MGFSACQLVESKGAVMLSLETFLGFVLTMIRYFQFRQTILLERITLRLKQPIEFNGNLRVPKSEDESDWWKKEPQE
jgi:hypothetical protein